MTAAFAGAGNAAVTVPARTDLSPEALAQGDDPTPELDAATIGEMAAAFLAAFRKGGDAADADLLALGFTPEQINRCGARALTHARRCFAGAPAGAEL